jgi:hypothetical protein
VILAVDSARVWFGIAVLGVPVIALLWCQRSGRNECQIHIAIAASWWMAIAIWIVSAAAIARSIACLCVAACIAFLAV